MRIPRIYRDQPLAPGLRLHLDNDVTHHLVHVLRLKPPADLIIFNGRGGEYHAKLVELHKHHATIVIYDYIDRHIESPLQIHLGQGISRGEKMDFTIQKSVELGVTAITPLITERCEVRLDEDRLLKKQQHWQTIATSACEQSGRNCMVTINKPIKITSWLEQNFEGIGLVLHHRALKKLTEFTLPQKYISLLIGPEGGLSEIEIDFAQRQGFHPLQLGPRVLRTETAALTAISLLQFHWGDMK